MVLCAGYGTRLGEFTRDLPKPMLPLLGKPLLAYLLGHLKAHGFRDVAVNLHFQPEVIRDWFGDGTRWQIRLHYSFEKSLLGTAGGLKNIATYFRGEDLFVVQYGDVLTDQDLATLTRFHQEKKALATLLVHQRAQSNSRVSLDRSNRIINFLERPTTADVGDNRSSWVNSGVCVCSPLVLDLIPPGQPADLPRDVFSQLVRTGRLFAVPLSGYRCAIDSPDRLQNARTALAEGRCRIQPLSE
jgi:mannose-1-phosphate guanylyltransferase/phosphomannomutase